MQSNRAPHKAQAVVRHGVAARSTESVGLRRLSIARADMHPSVYRIALFCWAAFMAVFWITFFVSASALFMIVVGTVYAVMFFGVPWVMSCIAPKSEAGHPSWSEFIQGRLDTFCGPIEAGEALLQVILVPLALAIGGAAIGYIIHLARVGG